MSCAARVLNPVLVFHTDVPPAFPAAHVPDRHSYGSGNAPHRDAADGPKNNLRAQPQRACTTLDRVSTACLAMKAHITRQHPHLSDNVRVLVRAHQSSAHYAYPGRLRRTAPL